MVKFTEGFHGIEIKQGLMAKASNLVNEVSFVLNLFFVSFDKMSRVQGLGRTKAAFLQRRNTR